MVTIRSVDFHGADGNGAGPLDFAIDMDGAGAALRDAAAIFGAGESHLLADDPEQRRIVLHLDFTELAVDVELCHSILS